MDAGEKVTDAPLGETVDIQGLTLTNTDVRQFTAVGNCQQIHGGNTADIGASNYHNNFVVRIK